MAENTSKTGQWIDSQTGKLVTSEPVEGYQIVPKGGEITPDVQAQIDRIKSPPAEPAPAADADGDPALTVTSTRPKK